MAGQPFTESSLLEGGIASAQNSLTMAPKSSKRPVMAVFPAQARSLEDAVLTLLGEQEIEPEEVTETNDRTRPHTPKRAGAVAVAFAFSPRRPANELPWTALVEAPI